MAIHMLRLMDFVVFGTRPGAGSIAMTGAVETVGAIRRATLSLVLSLERPLPTSVPAGSASAIFCTGVCFDPYRRISRLEIVVDGIRAPGVGVGHAKT